MRKHFAVAVALAMVLSMLVPFLPGGVALAASDNLVTRRALIIGNSNYPSPNMLIGPTYDAKHMEALFKQMDFGTDGSPAENGPMKSTDIKRLTDQTKSQILKDIASAFPTTGPNAVNEDDVSYFYYSGHGSVSDGEAQIVGVDLNMISLTELKAALDSVPGTKVVILDSCFSGGFIDKSTAASTTKSSASKSSVTVLNGHNRKGTVAASRKPALKKFSKRGVTSEGLFPSALKQKPPATAEQLSQQFNNSASNVFSTTSKYIDSGRYIVLTAATQNEYSYEFGFNTMYGPNFIMDVDGGSVDFAEPNTADSGEFTGMLVAGAGKVTFSPMYGEIDLLADYNGDKKITPRELEHYFKGSMICSDVGIYPSSGDSGAELSPDMPIFSYGADPVSDPRVKVTSPAGADGIPQDIDSAADSTNIPLSINLLGIPGDYTKNLVVYKYPKLSDGEGVNGMVMENPVRTLDISNPAAVAWDGKDDDGKDVSDGTYKIMLECGEGRVQESDPPILYPGVAVVLDRGISDPHETVMLGNDGSSYSASGDISISHDGDLATKWFTANDTGAMNVYADATGLAETQAVFCELYDAEGNVVNYQRSSPYTQLLYMPFYVKSGETYRLVFGIVDNPDKDGDTGKFSFGLRLNPAIGVDETVTGAGLDAEAWYVKPGESLPGNYVIMSSGDDDTAATIVDRNQVAVLGSSDDYYDKHFLISTPLVKDSGYLIITRDLDAGSEPSFTFRVNSPGSLGAFTAPSATTLTGSGLEPATVANDDGAPTYFKIHTGSTKEKWTFFTLSGIDLSEQEDYDNDPNFMLMDTHYNLIAANDDYNGYYDAEMAAVLQPNTDYILSCHGYGMLPYSFLMLAFKQTLTADDYVVTMPKAVFMDNSAVSLDRFGTVSGWGYNSFGEAGVGTIGPVDSPATVILPDFEPALDIWAGDIAGFARLPENEYCWWGMSFGGDDGEDATAFDDEGLPFTMAPMRLESLTGLDIADIEYGAGNYALVRTFTGELYELDIENDIVEPVSLAKLGEDSHSVVQIAVSDYSFFALCKDGKLFSWGENWTGECGTGDDGSVDVPTQVNFGAGVQIKQVAAGWDHVLALSADGSVYSWGLNMQGQLGLGSKADINYRKPKLIDGANFSGNAVTSITAGTNHSIAVDSLGNVYGWGANAYGDFGLGNASRMPQPVVLPFCTDLEKAQNLMSMSAGMMAVFAQDYSHHIYGYGGNLDGQLGYVGQSPEEGANGTPTLLMALLGDPAGHSNELKALHVGSGSVVINGTSITISLPAGSDSSATDCIVQPEALDYDATCKIEVNGVEVTTNTLSVAHPGESTAATITMSHAGGVPAPVVYSVTVKRAKSTNTYLSGITVTAGARLSPTVSSGITSYTITLPERMTKVAITPALAGHGARYTLNPAYPNREYPVGLNGTVYVTMVVTSQAGNTRTYYLTIKRPYLLSSLSASPIYSGYPSLSPGGTNTMKIKFSLIFASDVNIEVKKGTAWYSIKTLTAGETVAGANTWAWDGKLRGAYLAAGTYMVRVTPTGCVAKTLTVKILGRPTVTVPTLSPTTLKANGSNRLTFSVKWTVVSNVKVEIVNASGAVVYTAWSALDQAPTTKTLYWNGRNSSGSIVTAGTYRVKVTAGATVYYKAFTVTH